MTNSLPKISPLTKAEERGKILAERIWPFLNSGQTIIDIGCGKGYVTRRLKEKGGKVTAVDIKNISKIPAVKVIVYDGIRLPFPDKKFAVSILLMVLHHTAHPKSVLSEAGRVGKKVLVIEDIFRGPVDRVLNLIDGWQNSDRLPFWSSYKSDQGWREFFRNEGFLTTQVRFYQDIPHLHGIYLLERRRKV